MTHFANTALAVCAALVLTLSSIGAIVTMPPAEAHGDAVLVELA